MLRGDDDQVVPIADSAERSNCSQAPWVYPLFAWYVHRQRRRRQRLLEFIQA
jgi:hypothetical protein